MLLLDGGGDEALVLLNHAKGAFRKRERAEAAASKATEAL